MTDPVSHLEGIEGASLSVLARERSGEVLASRDPDRALAPASNTKLVTSALALDALGPEYRFETRVAGHGENIYLVGSGAPDLETEDLAELARGIAEELETPVGEGVAEIRGDLVLDGSRFGDDQLGPGWTWGDEQHYYGARSSAVALERNLVTVEVTAEESGAVEVSVTPDTEVVAVENDVSVETELAVTCGDGPDADQPDEAKSDKHEPDAGESDAGESDEEEFRVFTDHETGAIRVEGSLPTGTTRTEQVPVVRPERHCGLAFRRALAEAGVEVAGEVRVGGAPDDGDDPAFARTVESAPVADLLREMNVPSDNFVAEQLARAVASERGDGELADGERGDGAWDAWSEVAADFLESCGAETCRIRDGSGLSRYNLLTAEGVVSLLERAHDEPWGEAFFDSLPAPGEGTLADRLGDVPGVRAKTGTITGTSALSGVVRRDERPDVVFSVLLGGLTVAADEARRRQDEFVRALT